MSCLFTPKNQIRFKFLFSSLSLKAEWITSLNLLKQVCIICPNKTLLRHEHIVAEGGNLNVCYKLWALSKNSLACNLNNVYLWLFVCVCEPVCGCVYICLLHLVCVCNSACVWVCVLGISPGWREAPWLLLPRQQRCRQGKEVSTTPPIPAHTLNCVLEAFSLLSLSAPTLNVITPLNRCYQLLWVLGRWVSRVLLYSTS